MAEMMNDEIASVASLNEPVRGNLYRYVVEEGGDVSRNQAAKALGITRALAAFHLDRLVEEGLLEVTFRRLTGRTGPGAGRPSKLYRRSSRQVEVSLPPRQYELAARLLTAAVDRAHSPETLEALTAAAGSYGESLGEEVRRRVGADADRDTMVRAAEEILAAYGFEPFQASSGEIRLRNCPFHALAVEHRQLVCGMNLALMSGLVAELPVGLDAVLDPQPGLCCVTFRTQSNGNTD